MIKKHIVFIIWILLSAVALQAQDEGKTLNVGAYGVSMGFAQERSKIKATDVASNVLFIVNNTNKPLDLNLQISPPAGWRLFGKDTRALTLKPKDTTYVPLRVRPAYDINGNTNYLVNVFLSNDDFTITNGMWYIKVDKISMWQAYTPSNKLYFTGEKDSTTFEVSVSNQGNSDEALQVRLSMDKEILLIDNSGEPILVKPRSIYLPAGHDTTLTYTVKLSDKQKLPNAPEIQGGEKQKKYRLKIRVLNEKTGKGSNRSWSGNIDFFKLDNKMKIKETKLNGLPITFDFNTYDVLSDHTYSSLSLYGHKRFQNNSLLNYFFQADFIQNQLNPNSFLGNYQYLGYFHKYFSIEVGDIGANRSGSTLSGKGAKASVTLAKNTLGAIYIRKPKLFEDFYASGFGFFHNLSLKNIYWDNYYQHMDNGLSKVTSDYGNTYLTLRVKRVHSIRIGAGYSKEYHYWNPSDPLSITGFGARFGYSGSFKKINLQLNANYGSPNYTPRRGSFNVTPSIRYRFNNNYQLEAAYSYFDFRPQIYTRGQLFNGDIYNTHEYYSLKLFYSHGPNLFIFQPQYNTIKSSPIDANTGGLAFEYRLRSRSPFKFYANSFMGYSYFPNSPDLGEVFVAYVRGSVRYKYFQANARYYYGPYYQVEQLQFVQTEINPQKFYANMYYDYWFLNNKMRLNLNLNYYFNTVNTRQQLNTRPEVFYYAKSGFRFSFYARYILFAEGEYSRTYHGISGATYQELVPANSTSRFEFGAGIKFNVNMPTGLKRNYDVKVIAFRDMNGNGKRDMNEKGIPDMLIHIKLNDTIAQFAHDENQQGIYNGPEEYDLVTNGDGMVEYQNIPMGDYVITAMPLASMGGWFDGKTFYRNIDKNKTIYIPLSRGARISGGVLLERDRFGTGQKLNLSSIRVTAVNQDNGKTFSTLTTGDGNFVLFVPNGNYIIMINESAVDKHFSFKQNNIPIEVNQDFENYNVSFYLAEKQRNININGKRTRRLPIRRTSGYSTKKPKASTPHNDSLPEQRTQLQDPNYLPVVEPKEQGTVWLVQLFPNESARKLVTDFDTLKSISSIRCIPGPNGGFLYVSESFKKKKSAKKLNKKINKLGFSNAKVVSMVFGNKVETKTDTIPKDNGIEKTIKKVNSEEDRAYYRVEIKASAKALESKDFMKMIPDINTVYEIEQDGLFKYAVGQFDTFEEAKSYKKELIQKYGLRDSFVTQYKKAW